MRCRKVLNSWGGELGGSDIAELKGVVVCTIERANTIANKLMEQDKLSSLCCVVVDELHMVRACSPCVRGSLGIHKLERLKAVPASPEQQHIQAM